MLVRNGALLLSVNDPAPILEVMPHARYIRFKGHNLVAVKHTLEAAKVLKNLGLNAPSPMLYDGFRFGGRYTPMNHQVSTAEFLTLYRKCYCFNAMRTGKSAAALWALDYLKQRGFVGRILVICPLSVMNVWAKETFSVLPHFGITSLVGKKEKRIELLRSASEIAVINFDGVVTINKELANWKPDLIIVDEASAYCNPQNKRYKALKHLLQPDTRLWLLTGTPTPNAPTDAYGLIKLVCPESIPSSFKLFQETLMRQCGPYKWVPRIGATERVMELMQPAIRFTKEECLDLPPVTYNERMCVMSHDQKRVFDAVKAKMRHQDEDIEISAVNAAVKLVKLQQIMCGVVKDDAGRAVFLDPKSRLETIDELIEGAEGKVIIFAPFKFAMQMIVNHLAPKYTVELVNGDVSKAARDDIFHRFLTSTDPHVLVAHPKVASHGLDLSSADVIIWFAPTFSNEQYEQANERTSGPKQTKPVSIYHIYCHPVESQIYKVLQGKSSLQGQLLSLYSQAVEA